jgi:carnosine N-methyltransferase
MELDTSDSLATKFFKNSNELEQNDEIRHFEKVVRAFARYRQESTDVLLEKLEAVKRSECPRKVQTRLESLFALINSNASFLLEVIDEELQFLESNAVEMAEGLGPQDHQKVLSTLKQFAREWSFAGRTERDKAYRPVLDALKAAYSEYSIEELGTKRVLVPGSGLGRLPFEIACLGFSCQGNEFSVYMLIASNFIINKVGVPEYFEIFPWIHQFSNMPNSAVQSQSILIPDIVAKDKIPDTADFSMVGGDFLEVYGDPMHENQWDCVVTCFFIDTSRDLLTYIKTIRKILKPGGKWINIGIS